MRVNDYNRKYESEMISLAALGHSALKKLRGKGGKPMTGTEFDRFCALLFKTIANLFVEYGEIDIYGLGTLKAMNVNLYNNSFNIKPFGNSKRFGTRYIKTPILTNKHHKLMYAYIKKNHYIKKKTKEMFL